MLNEWKIPDQIWIKKFINSTLVYFFFQCWGSNSGPQANVKICKILSELPKPLKGKKRFKRVRLWTPIPCFN
jgi:hypothetical protein